MISSRFLERLPRLRFGSLRERISVLYAGLFTIILAVSYTHLTLPTKA